MIIYAKIANVEDLINKNHLLSSIDNNNTQESIKIFEYYLKQLKDSYIPFMFSKYCYKPYIYYNNWKYYNNFESVINFIIIAKEFVDENGNSISTSDILRIITLPPKGMTFRKYYINSPNMEEQKYGKDNNYFEIAEIDGERVNYDEYPFIFTDNLELFEK